ncbi:hydrogenase 4 membrane subunit [Escherichia coli]|uniref:hydrogenase 4 membrane subunit n=1 Tax=Escherichia coli TaxID=562 RepID=UPI0010CC109B|nr:hydrogenase 4 membrane subunit [Escherichia coli]GCO65792.1 hydrogenase 4 membrane subunit [Escherichia coli]
MTGSMIVNNLAGLMMLTSLFVISVKSYRLSCGFYACQSLVLVSIFATLSCLLAALIVLLCAFVVQPVKLPMATGLKPALAVALGHFLLGLLCIVSQRNILRQIFGYCLMENGSHLVLALLAWRAPELVEIGIATDAIFAVIVMVLLARKIWRTHGTLDVNNLTALKG